MEHLSARVRYLNPEWRERDGRPRICSRESRRANTRFYDIEIEDARGLAERGELDLDTNGFVLLRHDSAVTDFSIARTVVARSVSSLLFAADSVVEWASAVTDFSGMSRFTSNRTC